MSQRAKRAILIAVVVATVAGCVRIVVNIGGNDAVTRQTIDVDPGIVNLDARKGQPEGDAK